MDTDAPNFEKNYPLGGDRIGPVWLDLWGRLSLAEWLSGPDIAHEIAKTRGTVQPATVKQLLWRAEQVGILESRSVLRPGRRARSNEYRVSAEWYTANS